MWPQKATYENSLAQTNQILQWKYIKGKNKDSNHTGFSRSIWNYFALVSFSKS